MSADKLLSDGQMYFYSALAQIAGALVGLAAVALTFGHHEIRENQRWAKHAYRALRAGAAVLLVVVVASCLLLFYEGNSVGVAASRMMMSLSVFFLVGGATHHFWTAPREGADSATYQKWRTRGWLLTLTSTIASIYLINSLLPQLRGNRVGGADLALILIALIGGVMLAFLAMIQFMMRGRDSNAS